MFHADFLFLCYLLTKFHMSCSSGLLLTVTSIF